jgi:hypothetical protein
MRIGFRLAYADPGRDVSKATIFILCTYTSTKYYIRLRLCLSFPHPTLLCSALLSSSSPLSSLALSRRPRRRWPPHVRSSMVMYSVCPTSPS